MTPAWRLLATTLVLLAAGNRPAAAAPSAASDLGVELEIAARGRPATFGVEPASASGPRLALAAMPERRRLEVARALDDLAARWQRRRNPLFVPLDDDGAAEVDELLAAWLPAATAAAALAAGQWQSADGDLAVRAVRRCAAGARCVRLQVGLAADGFERRVRFLAWPIGYAVVARAASDAEAARVAERARAAEPARSRVALIITNADLRANRASPGSAAVARAAARIAKTLQGRSSPAIALVAGIAEAGGAPDDLTWLRLPPGAILAVPRLGSLAEPAAFVAEVRARVAAAGADVAWLSAPAAP